MLKQDLITLFHIKQTKTFPKIVYFSSNVIEWKKLEIVDNAATWCTQIKKYLPEIFFRFKEKNSYTYLGGEGEGGGGFLMSA